MNIKVSDRDLKLIFIIAIVGIIVLAWWGSGKITEENDKISAQVATLQAKYRELSTMNSNRKQYMDDTDKSKALYTGLMDKYANGLDQEHMIMNLKLGENLTGTWVKNVTLAGVSSIYTFGNITSTNPARIGQKVYISDNIGVNSVLNISYEATYEDFKNFLSYINDAEDKSKINSITMSYADATNVVSGSMQITQYGIVGSTREFKELELKSVAVGTDNIFESELLADNIKDENYGRQIMTNYDLFLMMNPSDSDVETVVMGQRDDINGTKTLATNNNITEMVELIITGSNGQYKVAYKLNNQTYPEDEYEEGVEFVCGETMDLLIISSTRSSDKDRVGAKLSIKNESDLVLNYTVLGEDEEDPRFIMGEVTGGVIGY